ncbi:MAG: Kdo hydroxylase family protein [Acidobacteriaceae bacterium]|nr:Kdo hydroxylase family protein [Acidobacteriaceae bacterium]MBV9766820.1 Kdo hydroxylase family protein [Acidobacteriaceae bacterium]
MKLVRAGAWSDPQRVDYRPVLEAGDVVFFSTTPFGFSEESKEFLRNLSFSGGAVHKNVAYRPVEDRVSGIDGRDGQAERVRAIMRDYSRAVTRFTSELLPDYARKWKLDYASFRPLEEEGRDLPLNKRNDLIHTDAFPSRPTYGDLILRVFTNISPSKTRVWVTSDPFRQIAERYAREAGLDRIADGASSVGGRLLHGSTRIISAMGLPAVPRSAYDRFMLRFHDYLKHNADFQANCTKYRIEFPPGSTWLTFTDVLPHSVQSGQHALEQTFIVARASMANPENAPVSILERICGRPLVDIAKASRGQSAR